MQFETLIRTIPDYPKPGIMFRDITTLLSDAEGFSAAVAKIADSFEGAPAPDHVAGIEARGFILGGAVACRLTRGFVPIRKKGKLPWTKIGQVYDLEYGTDEVEVHVDAIAQGERVVLVDDLIATGGTARAAVQLIRRSGGIVEDASFIVDLPDLGGRAVLEGLGVKVHTLCAFEGD